MVRGALRPSGTPVVPIEIAGQTYEAVIDTGFEEGFQLPAPYAALVNPVHTGYQPYQYADGHVGTVALFEVSVVFDGLPRVFETRFDNTDEIMLGVDALKDYRLEINFVAGTVVLERVASP